MSNDGCPPRQLGGLWGVLEGREEQVGAYSWEKGVQVPFVCVQGLLPRLCNSGLAFSG